MQRIEQMMSAMTQLVDDYFSKAEAQIQERDEKLNEYNILVNDLQKRLKRME